MPGLFDPPRISAKDTLNDEQAGRAAALLVAQQILHEPLPNDLVAMAEYIYAGWPRYMAALQDLDTIDSDREDRAEIRSLAREERVLERARSHQGLDLPVQPWETVLAVDPEPTIPTDEELGIPEGHTLDPTMERTE